MTINAKLQEKAYSLIKGKRGALIGLNPQTGEVLFLASSPSFNPNLIEKEWRKIKANPEHPLLNRALAGLYPPGSIFKIVTLSAALTEKITSLEKLYYGPKEIKISGNIISNFRDQGYGKMTLEKAFIVSCNTIFAQAGMELGSKKLVEWGERFSFNKEIPFELEVKKSKIPSSSEMDKVELAWTAVGQGRLLLTPFEVALITSAIANKGKMMEPFLIKEIKDSEGKIIFARKPKVYQKILPPEIALKIKKVMVKVVEEGTGKKAKIKNLKIGGKTGTAEVEGKSPHAWFTCFAPAENPQIVVTVLIENGGIGGKIAAPLVKSILESFFKKE